MMAYGSHPAARRSATMHEVLMIPCFVRLAGRSESVSRRSIALAGTLLVGAFTAAHGQLVTPKTVPVQQDEQFAVFPSLRAGMAGLSIALDDSLTDPFVNPAKAFMGGRGMMLSAPFNHNVTGGHGG